MEGWTVPGPDLAPRQGRVGEPGSDLFDFVTRGMATGGWLSGTLAIGTDPTQPAGRLFCSAPACRLDSPERTRRHQQVGEDGRFDRVGTAPYRWQVAVHQRPLSAAPVEGGR